MKKAYFVQIVNNYGTIASHTMTTESSDRMNDEWLTMIKERVQAKVGRDEWYNDSWSEFVKAVVWWLHDIGRLDGHVVGAAVGLIKYGIEKKEDLVSVAGTPPDADRFNNRLEPKGVLPAICDALFHKYVAPPPPPQQQHGKLLL